MFNTGLQNEDELVKSLNHKKIKDLSGNLQNLIRFIFKEKTANVRLKCKLTDNYIKPDIVITCEKEDDDSCKTIRVGGNFAGLVFDDDIKYAPLVKFLDLIKAIPTREE